MNKRIDSTFATMGMAAMLPGFQFAVEVLQEQLDSLKAQLAAMQNGEAPRGPGRPRKNALPEIGADVSVRSGQPITHPYWSKLTPEERKAEMTRRQEVAARKRGGKKAGAVRWARMTKAQRAEWVEKMQAGQKRATKAKATGKTYPSNKRFLKMLPKVNGEHTVVGAAAEFGLTPGSFIDWRKKHAKGIGHLENGGPHNSRLVLFSDSDMNAMRKLRNGAHA